MHYLIEIEPKTMRNPFKIKKKQAKPINVNQNQAKVNPKSINIIQMQSKTNQNQPNIDKSQPKPIKVNQNHKIPLYKAHGHGMEREGNGKALAGNEKETG